MGRAGRQGGRAPSPGARLGGWSKDRGDARNLVAVDVAHLKENGAVRAAAAPRPRGARGARARPEQKGVQGRPTERVGSCCRAFPPRSPTTCDTSSTASPALVVRPPNLQARYLLGRKLVPVTITCTRRRGAGRSPGLSPRQRFCAAAAARAAGAAPGAAASRRAFPRLGVAHERPSRRPHTVLAAPDVGNRRHAVLVRERDAGVAQLVHAAHRVGHLPGLPRVLRKTRPQGLRPRPRRALIWQAVSMIGWFGADGTGMRGETQVMRV